MLVLDTQRDRIALKIAQFDPHAYPLTGGGGVIAARNALPHNL